jgi:hypothetical protein
MFYFAPGVNSAYTSNLRPVYVKEDAFTNYDFLSETGTRDNVDWPIGIIYKGNAEVDKIKQKYSNLFKYTGSAKHSLVDEGAGWRWDQDKGIKDYPCLPGGNVFHSRLYAPSDDSLYNTRLGHYVLASAHIDHSECFLGTWFGNSEYAEEVFLAVASTLWGSGRVWSDIINFQNNEPNRRVGTHWWVNNGLASIVIVP